MNKTMTKPRVILAQRMPRFDSSAGERYGDVDFLFDETEQLNELQGQATYSRILARMEARYDAEKDYIALTGRVAIVAMMLMAASEISSGVVKTLIFDARNGGSYREHAIDVLE